MATIRELLATVRLNARRDATANGHRLGRFVHAPFNALAPVDRRAGASCTRCPAHAIVDVTPSGGMLRTGPAGRQIDAPCTGAVRFVVDGRTVGATMARAQRAIVRLARSYAAEHHGSTVTIEYPSTGPLAGLGDPDGSVLSVARVAGSIS